MTWHFLPHRVDVEEWRALSWPGYPIPLLLPSFPRRLSRPEAATVISIEVKAADSWELPRITSRQSGHRKTYCGDFLGKPNKEGAGVDCPPAPPSKRHARMCWTAKETGHCPSLTGLCNELVITQQLLYETEQLQTNTQLEGISQSWFQWERNQYFTLF